ncbi:TBC1 domain family member 22A [Nibea albiflora]|uniref:TBC1 domain family member 22A n=1 Tax=Nibea albiflora TaxID=240163 RepID=A0ACB7EU05_NIBAL|nr:TBC1 domain family member 22A [Nibea albiflora]
MSSSLIKAGNKPPPATPGKPKKATTFQEFESITSDAWDVGDDDDELLAMAAQNLNIEVVMETANKVIENHSKQQERQRQDDTTELEQREEDTQEEAAEDEEEDEEEEEEGDVTSPEVSFASQSSPHTDGRLVKSHSEAPIGSPKDAAGEHAALHRQRSLPHRPPVIPLVARMADQNTSGTPAMTEREASRLDKFKQLLAGPNTDLERRDSVLQRKRQEYFGFIQQYYDSRNDEHHQDTYRQIHIDIPRMSPESLVLQPKVTEIFERILFIWAIRHPASGYVQGINDLVTPFFVVYVFEYIAGKTWRFITTGHVESTPGPIETVSLCTAF